MTYKIFFTIILFFFLTSCGTKEEDFSVEHWYALSLKNLQKGNFYSAKESLEKIEIEYPYSKYSDKAEILIAFINYLSKDYDDAAIAAEKFIKLRPANQYVSYMYFLRAESYKKQMSDYLRDQTIAKKAKNNFSQLISRFGEQKYYGYSVSAINQINDSIASYNLNIGRVHQKKQEYISAINRFQIVINKYPDTIYAPESLYRLVETYYALGLIKQAKSYSVLLQEKHPDNIWNKRNLAFFKTTAK